MARKWVRDRPLSVRPTGELVVELQSTNEELETMDQEMQATTRNCRPSTTSWATDRRAQPAQRLPGIDLGRPRRRRHRPRPRPTRAGLEPRLRGALGGPPRRGPGPTLPQPRHRPAHRPAPTHPPGSHEHPGQHPDDQDPDHQPTRPHRDLPRHLHPLLDNDKTLRGVIVVVVDDPGQQGPTG